MPVPTSITDLSTTAGSNSPAGTETPGDGDNYIRALSAFIAGLRDGPLFPALGTVGAPAYSFTGDTNTGMWSSGADALSFSTGGTQAIWVDSSQNVGIGAAPVVKFHVKGSAATGRVRAESTGGVIGEMQPDGNSSFLIGAISNHPLDLITNSATRFRVTEDGRLYGTALHNNAGAVTGATNQYIASGTYTPTYVVVLNGGTLVARQCQWIRVGNVVHVSGSFNFDGASSGLSQARATLPIASNLTANESLAGTLCGVSSGTADMSGAVYADTTNDQAFFEFYPSDASDHIFSFSFTYLVA